MTSCVSCHRPTPLSNSQWCRACWQDWWRAKHRRTDRRDEFFGRLRDVVDAVKREHEKARRV